MSVQEMSRTARNALCVVVSVLALNGCGNSTPPQSSPPPPTADDTAERALSSYLHDLSPALEGVTVDTATLEHYAIPTTDGTVLDGWIRRPPGEDPQPLVLVVSPYYGGGDPSLPTNALSDPSYQFATFLVPRGYAVGFVSVAGTGNSGGCFHNGGIAERRQLADAVQFLAGQPWSNGAVGAIGVSYDGTTANELFVEAPPALKTVVPMEAISDYYRYSFNNGIVREDTTFFTTYYYVVVGVSPAGLEGGAGPTDPASYVQALSGEPCPEQLQYQQESVTTGVSADKTPHWQERDAIDLVLDSLDKPRPSMFFIQGYQDANVDPQMADGYLEAVAQTGVPLHIWFGQWVHAYPQPTGSACESLAPCRGDFFEEALLAWFDQFLRGHDTGILDAPAVQTQADDGVWRHEDVWPPVAASLDLRPTADGTLTLSAGSGTASYVDTLGVAQAGTPAGAVEVNPGSPIEFVSEPLTQPLRLTGLPVIETLATASDTRANLVATLLARAEDGTQRYLNFAALSLNHAQTLETTDADITGKAQAVSLRFFPQDNVIPAGSRLVLHIAGDVATEHETSGDAANLLNAGPSLLPVGVGAAVTLDLAQTRLRLPANAGDRIEPLPWLDP